MPLVPRGNFFDIDRFLMISGHQDGKRAVLSVFSRVDIMEHADHYEITTVIPGIKKEDIHISLENGVLRIEADASEEEKEGKIIRQKHSYGKLCAQFRSR